MKNTHLVKAVIVGGLLTLAGCSVNEAGLSVNEIDTVNFELPKQVKWKQAKNESNKGNILAEWIPEGSNSKNTPVRVIYQRLNPSQPTAQFMEKAIKPLQSVCADVKVAPFKTASKYADQASVEIICSQLGKNQFGTVSYVSVFTDGAANHVLVSEIKMPASKKAGVLNFKNEKQKQQAQNSKMLAGLMFQFTNSVRVCDKAKKCQ
ncbi:MAG: hypothetical protein KGV50_02825 [Gammaproteobacteria bacterium]|nr:hypothetical protein [Gammaproteobacteria bacterium]